MYKEEHDQVTEDGAVKDTGDERRLGHDRNLPALKGWEDAIFTQTVA